MRADSCGPKEPLLDGGIFGRHLAKTIERPLLGGGDAGCRCLNPGNLFVTIMIIQSLSVYWRMSAFALVKFSFFGTILIRCPKRTLLI